MPAVLERRFVLELPVDLLTLDGGVERVAEAVARRSPLHIVTMNAEMAMQAQADPELGDVIRRAGLVTPDGSGVVWAVRRQPGAPRIGKVAGVDLLKAVAARAGREGWSLYFLGAQPGVAQAAADKLAAENPGLRIAGVRDGYFKPEDEPAVRDAIREARPDVLLVALGVPRQEKWIARWHAELDVPVAMGVGGSFDVFAGRVQRAPTLFQQLHLEWLFRLIQEPWRFQRMRSTLPVFVKEVLRRGDAAPTPEVLP
jgi:N-acetylglucosaminyldiphosphoundecaprenol N-acetyl-beta-D-mannosaminyltransferase